MRVVGAPADVEEWAAEQPPEELAEPFTYVVGPPLPRLRRHNVVRESGFVCVFCTADLPAYWNVGP